MTGTADTVPKVNKTHTDYTPQEVVKEAAYGRFKTEILPYFGIAQEFLIIGKNCPCPVCGGHDRYRFEDRNKKTGLLDGSHFCRNCGSGDGINLVAKLHYGGDNRLAFNAISAYLGTNNHSLSPLQVSQLSQRAHEAKAKEVARQQEELKEKSSRREEVSKAAQAIINNCTIQSTHPYLEGKKLHYQVLVNQKDYVFSYKKTNTETGEKEDRKQLIKCGYLIIPLYDVNSPDKLLSVQFIYFNEKKQKWDKRPIAGTSVSDCIHVIKGDNPKPYCQIVEGWATGVSASISTGFTTIMAIDANGMASKAEKIKALYPDKQMLFLADNDIRKGHRRGEEAAHTASVKVNGVVVTPIEAGDWDDYRLNHGEDSLRAEIKRQIIELGLKPVEIKFNITGISANSSILLASGKGVSFADALINHSGKHCICPISGNKAIINADSIYCYETKHIVIPIIAGLYDVELISKYKKLASTKKRIKKLSDNPGHKNVYAFTTASSHRIGADIPAERFREWLYSKSGMMVSDEIIGFIKCLSRARVNQSKSLIALEPRKFKHRLHLKQKNGLLDWFPAVEQIKKSSYRMVAVKAHHGQGKSQDFMRQMFIRAISLGGAVAIAHRTKLVAQLADVLDCIHYDDKQYLSAAGTVKDLACCLHSFKHDKFLNHLSNSHSIFIDEASQALKAFYTDPNIEEGLSKKFSQAAKEAQCIYLLDADLTENDIKRWASLLGINEDEIFVITAEPPVRDFTVNLSCTASQKNFKTHIIEAIEKDLMSNTPCVLAVESKATARSIHKYFQALFPEKRIILLHGSLPKGEIDPFIENIQVEMASTDLLIHTSVIGTGVSIQHADKRFKKGYGLFTGSILSATESLQMLRRCRDVTRWEVTVLCRPAEMFMTSFFKDIGSIELEKVLDLDEIESSVKMEREQNKSLFIHAFRNLLAEYKIKLIEHFDLPEYQIDGCVSSSELDEEDIKDLLKANPCSLDKAKQARQRGYKNKEEQYSSESALCANHYKINHTGIEEAELWCTPALRHSAATMERLIGLLHGSKGEAVKGLLNSAGISLDLFKTQRLTQEQIKVLRDGIASKCAELYRLGLIKERYVKPEKIPEETPIKFAKEVLLGWGFVVETARGRANDRERRLDISVPAPLARRLSIDTRTDKDILREKVLKLKNEGFGYGQIAKELGLKDKHQARRLLEV